MYGDEMPPVQLTHRRSAAATSGAAPISGKVKKESAQGSGGASVTKSPTTTTPAKKPTRDIKQVWIEYKKSKTEALRNTLMENYLHLVRYNAERIHVKLPDEVELDDLMSAGIFGLMDAINAFDLDRGVKFETYCAPRIRGAILDELRSMDWVPRLVRSRAHKLH